MPPQFLNWYRDDVDASRSEIIETKLKGRSFRLERIVSHGDAGAPDEWYDQAQAEWVMLARGEAQLEFETQTLYLQAGDTCLIPPHCRHRVDATSQDALWVALHFESEDVSACHEAPFLVRRMELEDPARIAAAYLAQGWKAREASLDRAWQRQVDGQGETWVAQSDDAIAGYLHLRWEASYPPFREVNMPMIEDLNVMKMFQRRGIGSRLMDMAERQAASRSDVVGLAVGLTADYGAAQRLYIRRGYVPDGRGISSRGQWLCWGETARIDDDLVLGFTKQLTP